MKIKRISFSILIVCLLSQSIFSQSNLLDVNAILLKTQEVYNETPQYRFEMQYKMYVNHSISTPNEEFSGVLINKNSDVYYKIHNTIFLNNMSSQIALKVYEEEKLIEVVLDNKGEAISNSPIDLKSFIELFKEKEVQEFDDYYKCILTTGAITQIPYQKVELHISKKDYTLQKQVLYFLLEHPYTDSNGKQKKATPRLEIICSNFSSIITNSDSQFTSVATYLTNKKNRFEPSTEYIDYKIIQN